MIQSIETGRKEDGNRSIADKIIKRLHDLEKTVLHNHGRWAWELLQNAKDSVAGSGRQVSVRIIHNEDLIEFQHNGDYFTEKDIRGLINQISSKEVEEGEQSTRTGRFGTGFLTTHLLSKLIYIKGIVHTEDSRYFRFDFPLDRAGKTTGALIPKIEDAWEKFHASTDNNEVYEEEAGYFNTSFVYPLLSEEQQRVAETGINEFKALIPYVLAFLPMIASVEIVDHVNESTTLFENTIHNGGVFKNVLEKKDGQSSTLKLLYRENGTVAIAVLVEEKNGRYYIKNLDEIPKLFCDFPLIGTDHFYFPVVVNSFYFHPQTERDGIWLQLGNDDDALENKNLLEQALDLFQQMVLAFEGKPYENIYNIAKTQLPKTDTRYFDAEWYKTAIQQPLRAFLSEQAIVTLENGDKAILKNTWFPLKGYNIETRKSLWQYTFDLFNTSVSKSDDLEGWIEITWESLNKLSYAELITDLANYESIAGLMDQLDRDEVDTFDWYNEVLKFLMAEESNLSLFEKHAVIPNQNGNFLIKSSLYINKINDDELIEVLQLLGSDWNEILLNESVACGRYAVKHKKDIAQEITISLKNISKENPGAIKAISILSEWFDYHPEEGAEFFAENYRNRAELFLNTIDDKDSLYKLMRSKTNLSDLSKIADAIDRNPKLAENIDLTKELYDIINQFEVTDLQELKDALANRNQTKVLLPITQEIIVNMGITSIEEWQEAIEDKDLSTLFSHQKTPTTDMFVYAQSLISRAKKAIIAYLSTLNNYDINDLDTTTAPTVLAGILKDGVPISIVARPAYNGEVIIYYGSERDILDFEHSELWIDDGVKPRPISLGHLLKKAKIVKFPI